MSLTTISMTALFAAVAVAQGNGSAESYSILTAETFNQLGNNSLFTRWRPRSHFLSPHSWMNDPCGPLYDPNTNLYHLHYQWHPSHVDWGNITWGHSVSEDLFHWTDVGGWEDDAAVSFAPGYSSAPLAVFTGTTQAVNLQGEQNGTLLSFLTGIHYLPTNWKIPYEEGTEVQAMFLSEDGGETWDDAGTVLPGPPDGWNVTGWRDPSFFPSELLDNLTNSDEPRYYMVLGSGLESGSVPAQLPGAERPGFLGPRIPLYAAPANNLTDWTFLGALWEPAANESLGEPDVTGSYGYNFEVSSFFALDVPSTGEKAWFIGAGAEGGNTTTHWREQWALWNRGDVSARDNGSVAFEPNSGGALDWGIAYAQATWEDPAGPDGPRRVVWGWANEDFEGSSNIETAKKFGYQGVMNLPAELFIKETEGVLNCHRETKDGNLCVPDSNNRTSTAQTLGIRPLPDVLDLMRNGSDYLTLRGGRIQASSTRRVSSNMGNSYELTATLKKWSGKTGIIVGQSPDDEEYTVIYFDPSNNTIGVNREHSSLLSQFRNLTFQGHFEPYTLQGRGNTSQSRNEELNFHIVLDGSLLQVWVNERFALTARIYPSRNDSTGVSLFAGDFANDLDEDKDDDERCGATGGAAVWSAINVWKGLANAWPERPANSSTTLRFDTAEQTNNYTWWSGY
jgi:beta-fructofuranosidase